MRFEQSGEHEDFDGAISLYRDALDLRPAGHPDRSASLNDFASSLQMRFRQSGERGDLDKAISLHRDALLNCDQQAIQNDLPPSTISQTR